MSVSLAPNLYKLRKWFVTASTKRDDCGKSPKISDTLSNGLGSEPLESAIFVKISAIGSSMVEQIPSMEQPQHKIVSIIGNMSHYGRAGRHKVVMHLCDRVGSQVYPVPTPVVATSIEERELLQT